MLTPAPPFPRLTPSPPESTERAHAELVEARAEARSAGSVHGPEWSRIPPDLIDGERGVIRWVEVPLPAALVEQFRHSASVRLTSLLGLVCRYVGPAVCVQVGGSEPSRIVSVLVQDDDDLQTLSRRVEAALEAANRAEASGAPIRVDVGPESSALSGEVDLALGVVRRGDEQLLAIGSDGRFTEGTREAMASTARCYLAALAADPRAPLLRLPVLDPGTRQRVLFDWNATEVPRAEGELVHHLLEHLAARAPAHVVAELGDRTLTAAQLDRRSNALAAQLLELGVDRGVTVAVAMDRSFELLVTLFGVLKAGGAFVAVDPELPPERLAYVLRDARVHAVLTQAHLADALRPSVARAGATLVSVPPGSPTEAATPPPRSLGGSDLAYLVYTSGSTGHPKGVRVPHRALVNHAYWFAQVTELGPTDRVLHYASISFDAALAEVFAPIVGGARIVLAPPRAHRDLIELFNLAVGARITVLQAVPSVLRAALEAGALAGASAGDLRYLVSGGEALDHQLVKAVRGRLGAVRVGNFYGPSEACVDSTMIELDQSHEARRVLPIGRPIANTRCYVLDHLLQPVPIGATGQLWVGGRGLALGYQALPELTARKFLADPFRAGEQIYRTGDLARLTAEGTIEYLGRSDTQVKIRGYRLELFEIESALRDFPGISECAVVAPTDANSERTIVMWVVPARGAAAPSTRAVVAKLREVLPPYAIPSHIGVLASLPLNSSGKLDRRRLEQLPFPVTTPSDPERAAAAVTDPVARRLVPLWERTLGIAPIGLDDGFFELGGHSLKALRLLSEISREFAIELHAGVLFEAPTIRQLAARLQQRATDLASTLIPVQARGARPPLFFVPGGGGELFVFEAIAQALGREQPLYVVDLYAFVGRSDLPVSPTLSQIVACILRDVRRVQPHGPYQLAGYSMGGKIALELARQLQQAGQTVSALLLLDSDGPDYPRLEPLPRRLLAHAKHAVSLGPRGAAEYVLGRLPRVAVRLGLREPEPHRLFAHEADSDLVPPEVIAAMERAIAPLVSAWERHEPKRLDAPVTLLRAEQRQAMIGVSDTDPRLGWGPLLPHLRVVSLPCSHFDLLRAPNAPRLADVINDCLTAADG